MALLEDTGGAAAAPSTPEGGSKKRVRIEAEDTDALALCARGSDALIRHTAFTPLEDDDEDGHVSKRIAKTESA